MYTANEIEQIVASGTEAMATAYQEYVEKRKKGKYSQETWFTIGFIIALIEAVRGFDPENLTSYCLTDGETERIIETIIELTPTVSTDIIESDTFYLLQEDDDDLLQEDGSHILWY